MAAPVRFSILPFFRLNFAAKTSLSTVISRQNRFYVSVSHEDKSQAELKPERESETSHDENFRVYEIVGLKKKDNFVKKKRPRRKVLPPRYLQMPVDQDWTQVWPTAASFKYSVVPFPVRQGFIKNQDENKGVIPAKYANSELIKIPNFLHLTPAHVKKHCESLQKFCTAWPENLYHDEKIYEHFPLTVTTYTHCYSGPSLRHPKARVVKMQFKLSKLDFDEHGKDKFLRLIGDRYNPKTDTVTIEADRCPVKRQNYDYIKYLMTALYFESKKIEDWENTKEESDWERYYWDKSQSKTTIVKLLSANIALAPDANSEEEILSIPKVESYKSAVTEIIDAGEDSVALAKYKDAVLNLYSMKNFDK